MKKSMSRLAPTRDGPPETDRLGRPLANLRLSVTDRCNLRCSYCMPEEDYKWLPREDVLTFEELARLVGAFCDAGVRKVRLTGGEPLLRRDLEVLVDLLAGNPLVEDLALTTNAVLLEEKAPLLKEAGLGRLTISLDTLDRERYRWFTRRDELGRVLAGIRAAHAAGFRGTKLNTVVMRGVNDDELPRIVDFAREHDLEARFIEYMDVGGATRWSPEEVVPRDEILSLLEAGVGPVRALERRNTGEEAAPAERFEIESSCGRQRIGVIASQTAPFCRTCDRSRVTADGMWYHCLYAHLGTDLRRPLRAGATLAALSERIRRIWGLREDRGAEERALLAERGSVPGEALRRDPHLEMHTRGG